jgi:hypothetical protein
MPFSSWVVVIEPANDNSPTFVTCAERRGLASIEPTTPKVAAKATAAIM